MITTAYAAYGERVLGPVIPGIGWASWRVGCGGGYGTGSGPTRST
jgi:hypothetical protein